MIVTVAPGADAAQVQRALTTKGLWVRPLRESTPGIGPVQFLIEPHSDALRREELMGIVGVAAVSAPASDHPLMDAQPPVVEIAGVRIGIGAPPVFMSGPCSVESPDQISRLAAQLPAMGVRFLRGGAFKPRTSPYAFQGLGEDGLKILSDVRAETGLPIVTEFLDTNHAAAIAEYADVVQIGAATGAA